MTQEHKPQQRRENIEFAWALRHDAKKSKNTLELRPE